VNLEYLESKLETVDGEEVQRIQDNINSLFHHCVQALGEEHQIKVVNALQVVNARSTPFCLSHSSSLSQRASRAYPLNVNPVTFRAFGRHFYPKRLTISTFVERGSNISLW